MLGFVGRLDLIKERESGPWKELGRVLVYGPSGEELDWVEIIIVLYISIYIADCILYF